MGPSGRITTLEGRETGCLWVVVPEAEGSWPCGLQLRSAQERASGSLPWPLSLGDPLQMPREGGEILSWASGPCSGAAVRNRGAAGDPARDQLKGEEAWRTRLPGLPPQPLRCSLPAFGLSHHHHLFRGSGQCVWRCSARLRTNACHGGSVMPTRAWFTVFASEEVPGRRRRLRRSARLCRPDRRSDREEHSEQAENPARRFLLASLPN